MIYQFYLFREIEIHLHLKKIMKVTDPVCGLEFDEELSVIHEHNSKKYHFCCDGCKKIFIKKPKKWSKKSS